MYTKEELYKIYKELSKPFPEEAIERTEARTTKKGYNTTGIKYQYIVNRLNEVLGIGGFQIEREFEIREKQSKSGTLLLDATCDLHIRLGCWEGGEFKAFAEAVGTGGHTSNTIADAKKGAYTNGFKKTVSFFSCGWQAYAGIIDDDNQPYSVNGIQNETGYVPSFIKPPSNNGNGNNNGSRITQAQLDKLSELVSKTDNTDWNSFTTYTKDKFGKVPAYLTKREASSLISELIQYTNKKNGNGAGYEQ